MLCRYPPDVYSSSIIKLPIKVKGTWSFKTCCLFKERVLMDLGILQIRPTSRPVFVENPVYILMHCLFFVEI